MKIYFTRHGESEANTKNVYSNRVIDRYPLTQKGIQQTEELVEVLKDVAFSKIYSSPLLRAVQTSQILSKRLNVDFEIVDALREYDTGILEGKLKTGRNMELYEENEREWFVSNNFDHKLPGGESLNDIKTRFLPFMENLKALYGSQDKNILLVAHGGFYQIMLPVFLLNIDLVTSYKNHLENCEYIVAELRNNNFYCIRWRDGREM